METSRACSPELIKTSREEGKRSLIMYKKEEEEEKDEDDDDERKIGSEFVYGVEHGRKSWVISDAYSKRVPKPGSLSAPPRCQGDGCHADLSNAGEYHRRHKVCEHHAKAPKVLISGHEQRFCQLCSRFHGLSEFDNSKRSCRRRLAAHCERRKLPGLCIEIPRTVSSAYGKAARGSQLVAPLKPTLPPAPSHGPSGSGSIWRDFMAGRARMAHIPKPEVAFKCPRCHSTNTEFCYFINCDPSQPRHLCKTCRRYWTRGGTLRNVPAGGGCRRNQRSKGSSSKSPPVSSDRQTGSATSTTSASSNSASASDTVGQAYYGSSNQMGGVGDLSSMFDHTKIPVSILNLAADLAINQLLQILLSGDDHALNTRRIMICTRNDDERRQVFEKLMKDIDNMPCFNEIFHEVLWVDESLCQSQVNVKAHAQKQINLQLRQLSGISQSNHQSTIRKKYLVLGFDGYAEKTIDKGKLNLAGGDEAIMVLITTESRKQEANDKGTIAMDLAISTNDHLLPCRVFCQTVGNELVFSSSALQEIAVRIVQECGGHLLAIVLVGKSLENVKDVKLWEFALNKLSFLNPPYDMNMFQGVSRVMVTTFINFIWNDMNQILKQCLISCLFIPHIKTGKLSNELMHHWISWQLTDDGEGLHNLRELVECSVLIQDQSNDKYVRLPEDIHAILHSLNTLTPLFMKKPGLGLTEPPKDEEWHSVVHMELANNKLSELPLSPSSPELRVLMLQGNVDLTRIPNTFFVKMPLLTILDLSYTSIRELPDSLFELEQLREMYLKVCECFMKLSPKIGKLKKLEKLDLEGTQIIYLPEEIQELTNLQSLFLCFYEYRGKKGKQYTCSKIIPSQVISKLKGLKHLSIAVNPDDERWYENVQDILPEILGLEYLLTLSLYIPHLELLKFIPDRIFQVDFKLIVGRHMQRIISSTPSTAEAKFKQSGCSLKFVNGDHVPKEIKRLARHSKALFLERHKTIKNLSEFQMMNLEQLRVCILAECREMQTVVDGRRLIWGNEIFSRLLYLYISHMRSLRSIWEGPMPPRCFFGMLKSLVLQNCPELTTVFTRDFLGNLSLLKELMVKDCPKVTTLISDGSFKHKGEVFLPKLRKIMLLHLPELITISNGCYIGPRLNNMAIYDCPKLQSLSQSELSSQTLKIIKGEIKWWDQLQWIKEEWGVSQRPSKFDRLFSSIDNQVDIMTQIWNDDDDIDDDADMTPLQTIFEHPKQSADNISRVAFSVPIEMPELRGFVLDDGYRWRKYGQREMVGSKIPRSYYRCTHVGCPVKKRSQQSKKNPREIEICYEGIHTHTITQPRSSLHELQSMGIVGKPPQSSSVTNASMNNQGDLRTQSGVDDNDIYSHQGLQTSSLRIVEEEKQIANTSSRRSDTCSQASRVTNPTLTDSIDQSGKSAANADLESFSSMGFGIEPFANETYDYLLTQK